ncbi:flippase-like domain-containing protein [Cellulophaga baltica]|uniref:lysylphosphatidylglycerol synthase transmembrane domain-containing protein n=1 Tax=Cellulophaga TaxID=104264 RepID=UPI001C06B8B5|nr:lysylphosphatidylglycerol synthase transmembrane domain-containing protein [Cellulophaga sp. 1_MG-2023]MBU2996572.1 flippase-like domain-containing protein [Cellulophaga baltica]MDO6767966.1 lysylphosphatidylglycerol synthase transmembrane domain-containing protein [Cellulophaga sp. 1_MG-2023]
MRKPNKKLVTVIKIIISLVLIYFVFTKINFEDVLQTLKKTKPLYLFLALVFFVFSKVIASYRVNLYFHQLKIYLTQVSNLKLYLLGMFYNLFLPGGIGGDAYKGYTIKKQFQIDTKKVVAVLVLDRLSGLLLLFIYSCVLFIFIEQNVIPYKEVLAISAVIASIVVFWVLNKRFFNYVLPIFWKSFCHSAFVQLFQLVSIFLILQALSIEIDSIAYLFIFLISSIVSVIPLTIGGIGSRELTFYYGASLLNLNESTSIGVSMVFFLITAFVSFFGIYYHFKKPKLIIEKKED